MKSFLEGRKNSSIPALRPPAGLRPGHSPAAGARKAGSGTSGADGGNAHVDVVKEGDKVVRLIVTCGCGERVEIDCLYPAGS